ncbi:MAG: threonine/serine exporter family protein, partial [Acidaminococcaceae bacterium]|nr:threonine/serine exporter family protein [Acidaminococcaceae bacterium]
MACEKIMAMTKEQVMEIAITAGKILLCSGAETSRVEDTIVRMCALRGMNTVSVFCTPSVIIVSNEFAGDFTCMYRVSRRGTDLGLISEINELSFSFARWQHDYTETMNI